MKQVCLSKDYSTGIHSEKASCCKEVKHMPKKTINWNGILQLIASIMICVWGACTLFVKIWMPVAILLHRAINLPNF